MGQYSAKAIFLGAGLALGVAAPASADLVIYDSTPSPLPPNITSEGYQCCQNGEFGDEIHFAGTTRTLSNVAVTLSDWAKESDYETVGTSTGFTVPMTLTLYNVDNTGANPAVGSVIDSRLINAFVLWRPESGGCLDPTAYLAGDSQCYHGLAQNVTFDFSGVSVPDDIIYGLAFNTQTYGATPTGTGGPYNSLNIGLSGGPTVGTDVEADALFRGTSPSVFARDTGWSPNTPTIQFSSVPEPATLSLLGLGFAGLLAARRRRRSA